MQTRIERILWLKLDEEEQEEFLRDPTAAQDKVRAARDPMTATVVSADMTAVAPRSGDVTLTKKANLPKARRAAAPQSGTKRTIPKQTCSLCAAKGIAKQLPPHWMARHLKKEHGVEPAPVANGNSPA